MSRLLLFTNDFPFRSGDAVFVVKEIQALSERFDEIIVFCNARNTSAGFHTLPANVRLGGNLFGGSPRERLRWMLSPRAWGLLVAAAVRELRRGRLVSHLKLFLSGASVGLAQAYHPEVRAAASAKETVAYAFWGMGGGLALPWLRDVRARVVRVHRYDLYEEHTDSGYLPYRAFLFHRSDRILAISADAERYLQRYPETRGKVVLSRLGAFGPDHVPARRNGSKRTIVSCSAVTEIKRVDRILDTLRILPGMNSEHPVHWVHFGDGPLMSQLQGRLVDLPLGLSVELRGQVSNERIVDFYASGEVDVLINLSASEGVPVSIMEAIAYDIPIVATAVGGTPEIVGSEQRTGQLVEAEASSAEIASVLRGVLDASECEYEPRQHWARVFDAQHTSALAADLVRAADSRSVARW